jgi:hypothetical protein
MISDQDAALLKGAIQRARTAAGAAPGAPPGAIWNYINRPDPISARDFINAAPLRKGPVRPLFRIDQMERLMCITSCSGAKVPSTPSRRI